MTITAKYPRPSRTCSRHKAATMRERPFTGPVVEPGRRQNQAAHGNICRTEVCECSATRRTNINGVHRECSGWFRPEEV